MKADIKLCTSAFDAVYLHSFLLGQGHPLSHTEEEKTCFERLNFFDEETFHMCGGTVNRHNCHGWGSENPHHDTEHNGDSPMINVWCTSMKKTSVPSFLKMVHHHTFVSSCLSGVGISYSLHR
jgi:hypothetical protein